MGSSRLPYGMARKTIIGFWGRGGGLVKRILTQPWGTMRRHWSRVPAWRSSGDRKSTRLNSSDITNSYAVFCLKKKARLDVRRLDHELEARRPGRRARRAAAAARAAVAAGQRRRREDERQPRRGFNSDSHWLPL